MLLAALALSYGGFLALCLSMQRHHRDLFSRAPSRPVAVALRTVGCALLALALWRCITLFSASVGVVIWIGTMSAAALTLVGLLTLKPRLAAWVGMVAPAALAFLLLSLGSLG